MPILQKDGNQLLQHEPEFKDSDIESVLSIDQDTDFVYDDLDAGNDESDIEDNEDSEDEWMHKVIATGNSNDSNLQQKDGERKADEVEMASSYANVRKDETQIGDDGDKSPDGDAFNNGAVMNLSELQVVLSSENVEIIFAGLKRFNFHLKQLINHTVDYEISDESALVQKYFKDSPDTTELIRLWQFQQKHEVQKLETIIPEALANVITASRIVPKSRSIGVTMTKIVIRNHMKPLYKNLSSKKHSLMQCTVRLLAAMCVQSSSCCRELFETFNFTLKALPTLFKVRKTVLDNGRMEDVRGLYIRFLLGFLMYGDPNVKKGILETKDAISGIFKGSWDDYYKTLEFVFSVLKKKVIDDTSVPRISKHGFFNNYILELITKLYGRSDPSIPSNVDPSDNSSDPKTVAHLAHEFLLYLCTRPGSGLCAQEPGWLQVKKIGISQDVSVKAKNKNNHLLKWIMFLRPAEDSLQMTALLELLKNCPELVQPYWGQLSLGFEPRLSPKWVANMALAANIISLPVPSFLESAKSYTANDPSTILTPPTVQTLAENILPSALSRILMGRALQSPSITVRHVAAFVLGRSLDKFGAVLDEIDCIQQHLVSLASNFEQRNEKPVVYQDWLQLKELLIIEIRKRVPEVQLVLALNIKATEPGTAKSPAKKKQPKDSDDMEVVVTGLLDGEGGEDPTVTVEAMQCASLRLVRGYQKFFQDQIYESRFDFGKLVPGHLSQEPIEIQKAILEFLLEVPDFKWWLNPAGSAQSHLQTILHMYCNSTVQDVKTLARKVAGHFLESSFLFANNLDDTWIWIDSIYKFSILEGSLSAGLPSVISWFDSACCSAVKFQQKIEHKLMAISNKVSDSLTSALKKSIVDHVYKNRCLIESKILVEDFNAVSRFPFSPVIISSLDGFLAMIKSAVQKDAISGTYDRTSRLLLIAQCFCVVGLRLLYETQATGMFLCELLDGALVALDQIPDNSDTKHPLFYIRLLAASTKGEKSISKKLDGPINFADSKDLVPGFLCIDSDWNKLVQLDTSIESFKISRWILGYLLPEMEIPPSLGRLKFWSPIALISDCFEMSYSKAPLNESNMDLICDFTGAEAHMAITLAYKILFLAGPERNYMPQVAGILEKVLAKLILHVVQNETLKLTTWKRLRHFIFKHPLFFDAFSTFDGPIFLDCLKLLKLVLPLDNSYCNEIYKPYIDIVKNRILSDLTPASNYILSAAVLNAFSVMKSFMVESDLNRILDAVLVIPVVEKTNTETQNRLIGDILTTEMSSNRSDVTLVRELTLPAFRKLLKLLRGCPSDELDMIFESAVVISCAGDNAYPEKLKFRVTDTSNIVNSSSQIYVNISTLMDSETISSLVAHPTPSRLNALKYLVADCPIIRSWVLKDSVSFKGDIARVVLEGCLKSLVCIDEGQVRWSSTATPGEKSRINKLKSAAEAFVLQMKERILKGDSTHDNLNLEDAEIVFKVIRLELTCQKQEDLIDSLIKDVQECTEFSNLKATLYWLRVYMESIFCSSKIFESIVRVLKLFYRSRKKVVFPFDSSSADSRVEAYCVDLIEKLASSNLSQQSNLAADELREILKVGLKYRLQDPNAVRLITILVNNCFNQKKHPIEIEQILDMIAGHSQFKLILMATLNPDSTGNNHAPKNIDFHPCRKSLVSLIRKLLDLIDTQKISQIRSSPLLFPILAATYMGTVHESDREILNLWEQFEKKHGLSISANVIHWGQYSSLTAEDGDTLTLPLGSAGATATISEAAASEALAPIDPNLMIQSIRGFDLANGFDGVKVYAPNTTLYDPSFFLPLLANALKLGGDRLDMKKLVESNALGLAVTALASENENVRKAAYFINDSAYARFYKVQDLKEKLQLTLLLTMLKNGITDRTDTIFPRVPTIIAIFFSNAISVLSKPEHFMYPLINSFLLSRPTVDFEDVPMFYSLFNSSSDNCRRERVWLYRLLCDGLKNSVDYRIYKRRHVIDLVLSFFHFPLADIKIRRLTFELLLNASKISEVLSDLILERGLVTFLTTVTTNVRFTPQNPIATALPRLLIQISIYWFKTLEAIDSSEPKSTVSISKTRSAVIALRQCAKSLVHEIQSAFSVHNFPASQTGSTKTWWIATFNDAMEFLAITTTQCRKMGCLEFGGFYETTSIIKFFHNELSYSSTSRSTSSNVNLRIHYNPDSLFASPDESNVSSWLARIDYNLFVVISSVNITTLFEVVRNLAPKSASRSLEWACSYALAANDLDIVSRAVTWICNLGSIFLRDVFAIDGYVLKSVLLVLTRVISFENTPYYYSVKAQAVSMLMSLAAEDFKIDSLVITSGRKRQHQLARFSELDNFVSNNFHALTLVNLPTTSDLIVLGVLGNIAKHVWGAADIVNAQECQVLRSSWIELLKSASDQLEKDNIWIVKFMELASRLENRESGSNKKTRSK